MAGLPVAQFNLITSDLRIVFLVFLALDICGRNICDSAHGLLPHITFGLCSSSLPIYRAKVMPPETLYLPVLYLG